VDTLGVDSNGKLISPMRKAHLGAFYKIGNFINKKMYALSELKANYHTNDYAVYVSVQTQL
jgi:hypothetical protein